MVRALRTVKKPNKYRSKDTRTLPETQCTDSLPGILAEIVEKKRGEVAALRPQANRLEAAVGNSPVVRDFLGGITAYEHVSLIAECKRRSPGAGLIRPDLEMETVSRLYEQGGAAALSVLTDAPYFGGSLEDLRVARETTNLPILRKDFTLDPLQILEARVAGADAVLLIVRILEDEVLQRLIVEAEALGMAALVEVHDERELKRALEVGAGIIGINNRDLATFTTDLDTTIRLLERVPEDIVVVSESGIRVPEDVDRLGGVGVDAVLVGESLLRSPDPGVAAQELARIPRAERSCG